MKKSDFHHIKTSGQVCVGCGRGADKVPLKKLRTYSRFLACYDCLTKPEYLACANVNALNVRCGHKPHMRGPCQHCGCERYIHGLEGEGDRQLAACVGLERRVSECTGYGVNLGKCGRIVFVRPDGTLGRLCDSCEDRWKREAVQGATEAKLLYELDEGKEVPN